MMALLFFGLLFRFLDSLLRQVWLIVIIVSLLYRPACTRCVTPVSRCSSSSSICCCCCCCCCCCSSNLLDDQHVQGAWIYPISSCSNHRFISGNTAHINNSSSINSSSSSNCCCCSLLYTDRRVQDVWPQSVATRARWRSRLVGCWRGQGRTRKWCSDERSHEAPESLLPSHCPSLYLQGAAKK